MRHFWVDRIDELEPGVRATGVKNVSLSEDVFDHHFPGNPVYPGVLLLEGLAQTGGVLLEISSGGKLFAVMVSVDRARFTSFARPGDVVRLEVQVESNDEEVARIVGTAKVGEQQVAAARITFKLVELGKVITADYRSYWERMKQIWTGDFPEIDGD